MFVKVIKQSYEDKNSITVTKNMNNMKDVTNKKKHILSMKYHAQWDKERHAEEMSQANPS